MAQDEKLLNDQYRVIEHLGGGSFGDAFLVEDHKDHSQHVIKCSKVRSNNKVLSEEMKNMSLTTSDHVIRCFRAWIDADDGRYYMLLEYCDGGDLEGYLAREFPLSEEKLVSFFAQLLLGLDHIHTKHLIHRDIKLQNLMLQGSSEIVKIGDFGLSKVLKFTDEIHSTRLGTPLYYSPEVMSGRRYTRKTDVWSMGVVFYRLMTNEMPFVASDIIELFDKVMKTEPEHPCERMPKYSRSLGDMVMQMLTKSRTSRPFSRGLLALPCFASVLTEWPWRHVRFKGTVCLFACRNRIAVNVRVEPSMNAERVGSFRYGDQIFVYSDYVNKEEYTWYHVMYPLEGYCIASDSEGQHLFQRVDDPARYPLLSISTQSEPKEVC